MIIIRADGGKGIGMGHLVRTSALAKELSKMQEILFICDSAYKEGKDFLETQGFHTILSDNPLETLLSYSADCILTDSYRIDLNYVSKVREKFNFVGYIDDNVLLQYKADFIINQNFGAESLDYSKCEVKDLLLGTQYLLLREDFRKQVNYKLTDKVEHILLTVGGSDLYNYTDKLLSFIYELSFNFHVVIGPVFPYKKQLIEAYKNKGNIIFEIEPNMNNLIKKCDLAISSGGTTLYELGVIGVPTIGYVFIDNQEGGTKRMAQTGLLRYIGHINTLTKQILQDCILDLSRDKVQREKMSTQCKERFNPFGVESIVQYIISHL